MTTLEYIASQLVQSSKDGLLIDEQTVNARDPSGDLYLAVLDVPITIKYQQAAPDLGYIQVCHNMHYVAGYASPTQEWTPQAPLPLDAYGGHELVEWIKRDPEKRLKELDAVVKRHRGVCPVSEIHDEQARIRAATTVLPRKSRKKSEADTKKAQ